MADLADSLVLLEIRRRAIVIRREFQAQDEAAESRGAKEFCRVAQIILDMYDFVANKIGTLQTSAPITSLVEPLDRVMDGLVKFLGYVRDSGPEVCHPLLKWLADEAMTTVAPHCGLEDVKDIILVRHQWTMNHEIVDAWDAFSFDNFGIGDNNFALQIAALLGTIYPTEFSQPTEFSTFARVLEIFLNSSGKSYNIPRVLPVLSFGVMDSDMALMYPMLGHEIGHLAASKGINSSLLDDNALKNLLAPRESHARTPEKVTLERFARAWLEEIASDLVGVRLFGAAYLFSLAALLSDFRTHTTRFCNDSGHYPTSPLRIRISFEALLAFEDNTIDNGLKKLAISLVEGIPATQSFFEPQNIYFENTDMNLDGNSVNNLQSAIMRVRKNVSKIVPTHVSHELWNKMVKSIENKVPPHGIDSKDQKPIARVAAVLNAGWTWIALHAATAKQEDYRDISRLLEKAIEIISDDDESFQFNLDDVMGSNPRIEISSGVLSFDMLHEVLKRENSPLHIVPLREDAVQGVSYDVHLGHWFKLAKRTQTTSLQIKDKSKRHSLLETAYSTSYIKSKSGKPFVLHPQDFALAVTQEYFHFPRDIMAFVDGKSGIGRAGLSIATAAQVAPGFRGAIILELFNVGTIPLELEPGMPIAQLVFQKVGVPVPPTKVYSGDFAGMIRP
jgi:dCTP deaminase